MQPDRNSHASEAVPDVARLSELVQAIRSGLAGATAELHRIFYPGACFLVRRRLGRSDVDQYTRAVLKTVIQKIREDNSLDGSNLPKLVRSTLLQSIPAHRNGNQAKDSAEGTGLMAAAQVLGGMSAVERDALRRCYVLGEQPESFLSTLQLTPEQFRSIQSRARADFNNKTQELNVA